MLPVYRVESHHRVHSPCVLRQGDAAGIIREGDGCSVCVDGGGGPPVRPGGDEACVGAGSEAPLRNGGGCRSGGREQGEAREGSGHIRGPPVQV